MVNETGHFVVPNINEGEYASRDGINYYCIARDKIGYDVAVRSRTITVYYACESKPCFVELAIVIIYDHTFQILVGLNKGQSQKSLFL